MNKEDRDPLYARVRNETTENNSASYLYGLKEQKASDYLLGVNNG